MTDAAEPRCQGCGCRLERDDPQPRYCIRCWMAPIEADAETTLTRIDAPHFVAGILIENGRVVRAAPIVAWMIGKSTSEVEAYCARKGWLLDHGWPLGPPDE